MQNLQQETYWKMQENWEFLSRGNMLLLLLLSHLSRVQLCVTPEMAAHQAPPSLGFSRQEHWSELPFPSPMHESEKWKVKVKSLSRVRLLSTPWTAAYQAPPSMGFFQARVLEWGAIAFSNMPANLENSAVATGLEKISFHSNPKERQCQRMLKLPHNCTHLTR